MTDKQTHINITPEEQEILDRYNKLRKLTKFNNIFYVKFLVQSCRAEQNTAQLSVTPRKHSFINDTTTYIYSPKKNGLINWSGEYSNLLCPRPPSLNLTNNTTSNNISNWNDTRDLEYDNTNETYIYPPPKKVEIKKKLKKKSKKRSKSVSKTRSSSLENKRKKKLIQQSPLSKFGKMSQHSVAKKYY